MSVFEVGAAGEAIDISDAQPESAPPVATDDDRDDPTTTAEEFKLRGNEAFAAKRFEQAALMYTRAIELCERDDATPRQHAVYLSNRCACYTASKRPDDAAHDARDAAYIDPSFLKATRNTARPALSSGLNRSIDERSLRSRRLSHPGRRRRGDVVLFCSQRHERAPARTANSTHTPLRRHGHATRPAGVVRSPPLLLSLSPWPKCCPPLLLSLSPWPNRCDRARSADRPGVAAAVGGRVCSGQRRRGARRG